MLHTPGHSPGSVCLYAPALGTVFSGDTLFHGGPGATGRSYSDYDTIIASIRGKLLGLPPETVVRTGHGRHHHRRRSGAVQGVTPTPAEPARIAMWSGPRTVSTALMRSWENRPDTVVVDEPLYAFYLDRTGLDHPGREQVIASQPVSWTEVVRQLTKDPCRPAGRCTTPST